MKMVKKFATLILAVCLIAPCFSLLTYAANDGKIMFTDHVSPAVETGSTVEVKGVVEKSKGNFGKIDITMTYDTGLMKFKSGDGITETAAGTIQYVGDATNDVGTRKEFTMTFEALKAGTATIQISSATIKSVSGTVLDYAKGTSTIKITGETVTTTDPGTVSDTTVDINGTSYKFADNIPQNVIPEGFAAAKLDYEFAQYNALYNESMDLYLVYLVDSEELGQLFLYEKDTATFAPYEAVEISDTTTIVLLSDVSSVILPDGYKTTEVVSVDGISFPAWVHEDNADFRIVYAVNSNGEKALYQMDTVERTYQRFQAPEVVEEEEQDGFIGKISTALENHLDYFILGAGLGLLLLIVIVIVLSVKLYNRNAELDEIYDEYGLQDDEDTEDDIVLDLDDEDDEDDDYDEDMSDDVEDAKESEKEVELLLQEGMKEVFPEEAEVDPIVTVVDNKKEEEPINIVIEPVKEAESNKEEDTLGAILAQQKEADKEEFYDDDGVLENFSLDFIDLDD